LSECRGTIGSNIKAVSSTIREKAKELYTLKMGNGRAILRMANPMAMGYGAILIITKLQEFGPMES